MERRIEIFGWLFWSQVSCEHAFRSVTETHSESDTKTLTRAAGALGTAPVVQKGLLRHADIRTALDIYTRAVSEEKREASSRVAHALL
jgi:hypothetical protein